MSAVHCLLSTRERARAARWAREQPEPNSPKTKGINCGTSFKKNALTAATKHERITVPSFRTLHRACRSLRDECDVACDFHERRNGCPAPRASRGWRWRASRRYSGAAAAGEAAQDGHGQASPGCRGGSGHHNHGSSSEGCSTERCGALKRGSSSKRCSTQDCSSRTSFQCCCSQGCNSTLQHHQQAEKGKGRQAETDEGRRSSRYAHLARHYHVHPRVGRADRDSLAAYAA